MKIEDYEKYYQSGGSYVIPIEVFNELFNELEAWKDQTKRDERLIRLVQTEKVFDTIAGIIKEGSCSYRHLIYDKLGFDGGCYEELLSGMAITNAICDLEDLKVQHEEDLKEIEKLTSIWKTKNEEISKLKEEIKAVNKGLRKVRERAFKNKYKSLDLQKENKELKKQLHEASLTIQEMVEQTLWCPSSCDKLEKLLKENQRLKKELENAVPVSDFQIVMNKYKTQREEFRNYLEDEIKNSTFLKFIFEMILQKYEEIMEIK